MEKRNQRSYTEEYRQVCAMSVRDGKPVLYNIDETTRFCCTSDKIGWFLWFYQINRAIDGDLRGNYPSGMISGALYLPWTAMS